jgi:hypothetical protein
MKDLFRLSLLIGLVLSAPATANALPPGAGGEGTGCFIPTLQGTLSVQYPVPGGPSYFQSTVAIDSYLNGTFDGWCSDTTRTINASTPYSIKIFTDYANLPAGAVDFAGNFNQVHWILNQGFVGTTSPGGFGIYTYGDVQRAIWTLLEALNSTAGVGAFDQNRVNEILAGAAEDGKDFEPSCDQLIAVVLVPEDASCTIDAQVTLIPVTPTQLGCCTIKSKET